MDPVYSESVISMAKTNAERQRDYRQRAAVALREKVGLMELPCSALSAAVVMMKAQIDAFIAADPRAALFSQKLQSRLESGINPIDAGILTYMEIGSLDQEALGG